jgi:hypothetical protein
MAADGVTTSEIARRLGINRRTAARLVEASQPPSYSRAPAGSMLDPLEPVLRGLIDDWPEIRAPRVTEILRDDYGYRGSVDLVRKRRDPRRRGHRRGDDRPARPPRRDPRAQRRLLPATRPRPRPPRPRRLNSRPPQPRPRRLAHPQGGSIFNRRNGVNFRPALTSGRQRAGSATPCPPVAFDAGRTSAMLLARSGALPCAGARPALALARVIRP